MEKQPCSWCSGLYTARGIRLHEMHCVKNPNSPKHKKSTQPSTGPSIESVPSEVQSRSVRDIPPEVQRDIEELANLHQMSFSECIKEILGRAMRTRDTVFAQIEDGHVETLYAIESAIGLWGDAGDLYEFLLNMTYEEIEAKADELNDQKTKENESDEARKVELSWEDAPAVADDIARIESLSERISVSETSMADYANDLETVQTKLKKQARDDNLELEKKVEEIHSEFDSMKEAIEKLEESSNRPIRILHKNKTEPEPEPEESEKPKESAIRVTKNEVGPSLADECLQPAFAERSRRSNPSTLGGLDDFMIETLRDYKRDVLRHGEVI